ncbi:DUF4627 domain-containing protein [Phocaeicola plebeius]|nr:DUF4627 domain-containing protein [Phocaeicola plebeius]
MLKYMRKVFIVAAMAFLAMGAQAQNLVKNGNFDTPLNNEKTYASIPSTEDWFAFDKTNGATTISLQQMTKSMAMPSRLKQRLTTHGTKLI